MDSVAKIDKEISALQQKRQDILDRKKEKSNKVAEAKKLYEDFLIKQAMEDMVERIEEKNALIYFNTGCFPRKLVEMIINENIRPEIQDGKAVYRACKVIKQLEELGNQYLYIDYQKVNNALKKICKILGFNWIRKNYGGIEVS